MVGSDIQQFVVGRKGKEKVKKRSQGQCQKGHLGNVWIATV